MNDVKNVAQLFWVLLFRSIVVRIVFHEMTASVEQVKVSISANIMQNKSYEILQQFCVISRLYRDFNFCVQAIQFTHAQVAAEPVSK